MHKKNKDIFLEFLQFLQYKLYEKRNSNLLEMIKDLVDEDIFKSKERTKALIERMKNTCLRFGIKIYY